MTASLTFAIIARRLHKRDASRDVLEKVTLIKEIRCADPHRAHIEILADLALPSLAAKYGVANFVDLQRAWEKTLDTSELNKKFFREVANWYFWAVQNVIFPAGAGDESETRNAVSVIRLITRLIFVWFIKEKGLVPNELFDDRVVKNLTGLADPSGSGSAYYKAILQNLFFATLNTEMGDMRRFRGKNPAGLDAHHGIATVYRYEDYFSDPAAALRLFANIPFLNGGLFECLDRPRPACGWLLRPADNPAGRARFPLLRRRACDRPERHLRHTQQTLPRTRAAAHLRRLQVHHRREHAHRGGDRARPGAAGQGLREPAGGLQPRDRHHGAQADRLLLHPARDRGLHGRREPVAYLETALAPPGQAQVDAADA